MSDIHVNKRIDTPQLLLYLCKSMMNITFKAVAIREDYLLLLPILLSRRDG